MNQKEMVLVHMKKHGGITAAEAMNFYGIARLSARIWDLRRDGIRIITDKQKSRNRYGRAVVYDRYRLGDKYEGQHNDVQDTVRSNQEPSA